MSNQELPGLKDQKLSQENFSSLVPSIGEKENAVKMPTCISIIRTFSDNLINWTRIKKTASDKDGRIGLSNTNLMYLHGHLNKKRTVDILVK